MDGNVQLRVELTEGEDSGEAAVLARRLRAEVLQLNVDSAGSLAENCVDGAKGLGAAAGWLVIWLGPAGLGAVVRKVAEWTARTGRTVEVTVDGDTLKLSRATDDQQDRLVDAFVARHSRSAPK